MTRRSTTSQPLVWQVQRTDAVGGTRDIMEELAARLTDRGVEVQTVYLREHRTAIAVRGNPIGALLSNIRDSIVLLQRLFKDRPKVLVTFTPLLGSLLAPLAALLFRTRTVATHHILMSQMGGLTVKLDKLVGSSSVYRRIIACAPGIVEELSDYPPAYRAKLKLIPNGVESRGIGPGSAESPLLESLGLPPGSLLALSVGRLTRIKNHAVLVQALQSAPDWHLLVLGEGEERASLLSLARSLNVADRLHMPGAVSKQEVRASMIRADAYVQPSRVEGLSLALLEAMSFGLPCLVGDIPANRYPLEVADTLTPAGCILSNDAPKLWSQALNRIQTEPAWAAELGEQARQIQRTYFDREQMYGAYIAEIEEQLDQND